MKRQILTLLLAPLTLAVPAQAEWFDQGKVAYKTPDDKWRPAAILVEPGKIEIYNRKDRGLVAEFTKADSVEHKIHRRRRWREAHAFGAALVGGYIFEFAKARAYQGNVGITRDGEVFERTIDRKRLGMTLGVLGGIAAAVALTKAKEPYTEITSGDQTIRLRVNRDDLVRFEHSLKPFVKTDKVNRAPPANSHITKLRQSPTSGKTLCVNPLENLKRTGCSAEPETSGAQGKYDPFPSANPAALARSIPAPTSD